MALVRVPAGTKMARQFAGAKGSIESPKTPVTLTPDQIEWNKRQAAIKRGRELEKFYAKQNGK